MTQNEDNIISEALSILETRLRNDNAYIQSSKDAANFLTLKLADQQREVFAMMAFTSRLQLIEYRELFFGTVDQASVYPREVVKAALNANAVAVIIAHNHPSGNPEPSDADYRLTHSLKDILDVLDIKLADHIVIGAGRTTSFADQGLL